MQVLYSRLEMVIGDKENKLCTMVNISCLSDVNVIAKAREKVNAD